MVPSGFLGLADFRNWMKRAIVSASSGRIISCARAIIFPCSPASLIEHQADDRF
jgi:hypothetical protein